MCMQLTFTKCVHFSPTCLGEITSSQAVWGSLPLEWPTLLKELKSISVPIPTEFGEKNIKRRAILLKLNYEPTHSPTNKILTSHLYLLALHLESQSTYQAAMAVLMITMTILIQRQDCIALLPICRSCRLSALSPTEFSSTCCNVANGRHGINKWVGLLRADSWSNDTMNGTVTPVQRVGSQREAIFI